MLVGYIYRKRSLKALNVKVSVVRIVNYLHSIRCYFVILIECRDFPPSSYILFAVCCGCTRLIRPLNPYWGIICVKRLRYFPYLHTRLSLSALYDKLFSVKYLLQFRRYLHKWIKPVSWSAVSTKLCLVLFLCKRYQGYYLILFRIVGLWSLFMYRR